VHRDLKPGNVMLVPDGPMKILDFGLAKARGESISDSSARLGTASYMAPEQVRKEAVDGRADLWALGVVLYEMLTGKKPFAGEHVAGVAHAIVYDDPVPPSALRAEVPTSVEALVLRLLHKDPAMRHSTAEDVLTALLGVGAPAESAVRSARTPSLHIRPILSGKRQWVLAVVATVIMGVVGVVVGRGILVGRSGDGDAGAASRVVVMPFENRTGVTELDPLGVMVAEWVTQGLTEAPFLTVLDTRGAQAATRTLGAEAGPITVGRETGAGVVVAGSFFLQGDSLQFLAQISSTADGGVLFGIAGIAARRDRPLEGAEQLRQRVLAAFASRHDKDVSSFEIVLSQPPTYAAYREYVEGLETIMGIRPGDFRGAAQRFLQAAMLDTTFLTARVWAAQAGMLARLYGSFQDRLGVDETWAKRADSLISGLQLLRDRLTPFDRARLDFVVALGASDLLEVYRAALRLVDASPGSVDARREAAMAALRVLRPREALRRLEELDPNHGLLRGWEGGYWGYVMTAYHILGQHEDELTVIQHLDPSSPTVLYAELRALAALGRTAELDSIARAELPATGQSGLIAFGVAGELTAHGYAESAHHFAQYWSDHPGAPPPSEPEAARDWLHEHSFLWQEIGVPWCYLGEKLETRSLAERARDEWVHGRAELALLVGDAETAATRAAELRNPGPHGLLLARILAAQGKVDAARAALAAWEARMVKARGTLRGLEIERASVLVRLGDLDGALAILSEGVGRRPLSNLTGWWNGHAYPDFAPLLSNPRFQALMKPRG
jgi:TolB-like protein